MSQELLSDADIESLTTEFGERVDFNTVELDGVPGMFRRAVNAADVTRHKVQRAFTSKHDPNRNHGLDNAKDRRDNEYLYKHDKRKLKHDEMTSRINSRNERRDADKERADQYRKIKDRKDDRTTDRKEKRDAERGKLYHNGNNSGHVYDNMHYHADSVSHKTRLHDSHDTNNNEYDVTRPPHTQNENRMYPNPYGNNSQQEQQYTQRPTAPHIPKESHVERPPSENSNEERHYGDAMDKFGYHDEAQTTTYHKHMRDNETETKPSEDENRFDKVGNLHSNPYRTSLISNENNVYIV